MPLGQPASQHPPSHQGQAEPPPPPPPSSTQPPQLSSSRKRILTDPDPRDSSARRKKLKTRHAAGPDNAAGPLPGQPPRYQQRASAGRDPSSSSSASSAAASEQSIDPHVLGQQVLTSPNSMGRTPQAGGEASDRRDWAVQAGSGKESPGSGSRTNNNNNNASPLGRKASGAPQPLLSQRDAGELASQVDHQNITSLSKDKGSERGQKRRLSVGQAEAEVDQERLLNIVHDLDKLEKEQKDFGKQQLQAIKEGSV